MKEIISISKSSRSILRYPGGKSKLARFIALSFITNNIYRPLFIEPFCGGASVSIALLESNIVDGIVLNDVDPIIASLWKCIFSKDDAEWLANSVMQVPLTIEFWEYQKRLIPRDHREAALQCLFLNRTSFSGILRSNAGPLGGRSQLKWTIGCRFNRERLANRINELLDLAPRVRAVMNKPWQEVCKYFSSENQVFYYLDPPFFHKANRLYRFNFTEDDHISLRNFLLSFEKPWLLTYDCATEITKLYEAPIFRSIILDRKYSAQPGAHRSSGNKEIILSNLEKLPHSVEENNKLYYKADDATIDRQPAVSSVGFFSPSKE